jgi:hypothetical protein
VTRAVNGLLLPDAAAEAIVAEVARYGRHQVETGGFMLTSVTTDVVTAIAHAGTRGILRRHDLFQISDLALDALFAHVEEHGLSIPAQYHSHGLGAFMSDCDLEHGLSVEGFTSTIVPFFSDPPPDPSAWGWWRFARSWIPLAPPVSTIGEVEVLVFDEDGVRGR